MTNTPSNTVAQEIEAIKNKLAKATAAIHIFGDPAIAKVDELNKQLAEAKERYASALCDEAIAARTQRLSKFSDIRVETKPGNNLISTGFVIRYTRVTWDMAINESVPKQHECNGFAALSNDAYEYLLAVKPQAIPAEIMALAPGNPEEAMSVYMAGKARGYFKGRAVAA